MRRIVNISSRSYIAMQNGMMSVTNRESQDTIQVPIRDIETVVIEHPATVVTTRLLAELAHSGVSVIFCGSDHMPAGLEIPLNSNLNSPTITDLQLNTSKPLIKQLWKSIVQAKILNQAAVMKYLGHDDTELLAIASEVKSNDVTNREAVAAVEYFRRIIPNGGRWGSDYTSPLNYGYTIIRAGLARSICSAGLIVSKGIHHHNSLNPLNLADDLIEPFRPIMDAIVLKGDITSPLNHSGKLEMLKVHETIVLFNGRRVSCQQAYTESTASFINALTKADASLLKTPSFIGLTRFNVI